MLNIDLCRLSQNIEEIAQYDLNKNNVFGSGYYVRHKTKVLYNKCFGVVAPDSRQSVDEKTVFRLASMTKPITAMAVLILVDNGLISLDDHVKNFLPQFENIHITSTDGTDLGIAKKDMTILHLLTHTSGIGDSKASQMTKEDKRSTIDTVNFFVNAGLDYEPFTKQSYSPTAAFDVLAAIIEKVSGENFENFLQREIFKPCQMIDTTFLPTSEQLSRLITMHDKKEGKNVTGKTFDCCIFEDYPLGHNLGGAGLISTLSDYSHFVEMILNDGKTENKKIISKKTLEMLSKPYVNTDVFPGSFNRGLGVRVVNGNEMNNLPHGSYGWSGAYGTHFWIDPVNKIAGVYMRNSRFDGGATSQSAQRFEKAVYDAFI